MHALIYANDKLIKVTGEVEIAVVAIVVEIAANNRILTLIVHNWTFYPGRFPACL